VLTWSSGGVGAAGDVLAGRVARSALDVFRRVG
jgi:aspartate carbamoyltransferase catalytic subunit